MGAFTEEHNDRFRLIQAVQILGAKVTKDCFFPRWKVNEFHRKGLISFREKNGGWSVTVRASLADKPAEIFVPHNPQKEVRIVALPT